MSLKKCVLKKVFKESFSPHSSLRYLPSPYKNFYVAFLFITLQLTHPTL